MTDISYRPLLVLKGLLFLAIAALSGTLVLLINGRWVELLFLFLCIWSSCRFYYFLFHVLEKYVGLDGRYAGISDLFMRLWRQAKGK